MRRKDRQITEAEAFSILETGVYGVLSMVSSENEPYGVPLSYFLVGDNVYFHCAMEGRKIESISSRPRVSFCVVGKTQVLPDQFSIDYESCIVTGVATESVAGEKQAALEGLVEKYSRDFISEGSDYIRKLTDRTRVFKIKIESITGKSRV